MLFMKYEAEYGSDEIDGDIKKVRGHGAIPEEIQREPVEVDGGDYEGFDSFRKKLVTHYAAMKYVIHAGRLSWKRPPAPVCVGQKEARFVSKFHTPPPPTPPPLPRNYTFSCYS